MAEMNDCRWFLYIVLAAMGDIKNKYKIPMLPKIRRIDFLVLHREFFCY